MKNELKLCPFPTCGGKARPESDAPWDEVGYTHCLNPNCPATLANNNREPWRVPIPLWQLLPRWEECPARVWVEHDTYGQHWVYDHRPEGPSHEDGEWAGVFRVEEEESE